MQTLLGLNNNLLYAFVYLLVCLRQGFLVQLWLSWNPFCKPNWTQTQRSTCLCFLGAGIKSVHHHYPATTYCFYTHNFMNLFLKKDSKIGQVSVWGKTDLPFLDSLPFYVYSVMHSQFQKILESIQSTHKMKSQQMRLTADVSVLGSFSSMGVLLCVWSVQRSSYSYLVMGITNRITQIMRSNRGVKGPF